METFITTWPLWTYLIGISIAYAIIEEMSESTEPIHLLVAAIWPAILCMTILACILWPTYYLTKKLINYLKTYQNVKKIKINKVQKPNKRSIN